MLNKLPLDRPLFSYSSGRFLYNEPARLRERHVEFNASALEEAITMHVGHGNVKSLVKISEGGFNRVLLATMEDGFQAIVKIPFWISVPNTYATASEVATLTFLRAKGIPVPEVYAWSSTTENPVGVEYIIMEYASGVGADTRWFKNTKHQKHALVTGIVNFEKTLFEIPFGAVGSLYFKSDLPPKLQSPLYRAGTPDEAGDSQIYCIGPITDYMFWYGQRAEMELDRGPWNDPKDYLIATAEKEIQWITKFGKPVESDFPHNTVFPGIRSPQDYLVLLEKYLSIAPHLLPRTQESSLSRFTLRHPDLTPSNVFICPDTLNVKCIIDWQHTVITPLLLASGYPKMFENPDPEPPTGLVPPKYPPGYDTMNPEEKSEVDELIRRQSFFYLYRVFNGGLNKIHLEALRNPLILQRQHVVDLAGRQWSGNLISLRGALMRIRDFWQHLPVDDKPSTCPIEFSEQESDDQTENEPMWYNLNALVSHWRDELGGLSEEGWLPSDKYDSAVKRNESLKAEFAEGGSPDELEKIRRGWPFQDHEEFF
ncbi:serine/threonine protein kinase [Aspergillus steynii IBT 23096]|uniref:Serine/threonine protein kinase n=1 Tax=Aspergillus steynii IBT 23096 TaxID=1392250 RepID=A0A2I2GF49_9EURO|nr:serine/threonine protein kinase [Aspergillus steynii IBT 23096]PLB51514.1 serine/threonine protein kinase [Aspergillus steynii IBT 23096]